MSTHTNIIRMKEVLAAAVSNQARTIKELEKENARLRYRLNHQAEPLPALTESEGPNNWGDLTMYLGGDVHVALCDEHDHIRLSIYSASDPAQDRHIYLNENGYEKLQEFVKEARPEGWYEKRYFRKILTEVRCPRDTETLKRCWDLDGPDTTITPRCDKCWGDAKRLEENAQQELLKELGNS